MQIYGDEYDVYVSNIYPKLVLADINETIINVIVGIGLVVMGILLLILQFYLGR